MMNMSTLLRVLQVLGILAPTALGAAPTTLSGQGIWIEALPSNAVGLSGLGTNTIVWGAAVTRQRSGYSFVGNSTSVEVLDGTRFTVGTLTHNNFPIASLPVADSITKATLRVTMDIMGSSFIQRSFSFDFLHAETSNSQNPCPLPFPHPNPGGGGCEDVVSLETLLSQEVIEVDGQPLKLEILGFLSGGSVVSQFLTHEDASNSAFVEARFTSEFPTPIPEPSTLVLMALGLGATMLAVRRNRTASHP